MFQSNLTQKSIHICHPHKANDFPILTATSKVIDELSVQEISTVLYSKEMHVLSSKRNHQDTYTWNNHSSAALKFQLLS
jgi:hypothetical protein